MPVRSIPKNNRSLTGQIASNGRSRPIAFESSLERDFALLHLFDAEVATVEEQPVRIEYRTSGGRNAHYTPDFLVTFHANNRPSRLVEVKYRAELERKAEQYAARFEAARAYAMECGWAFEVVTEAAIRTPRLDNARFLLPLRKRRVALDLQRRLLTTLAKEGTASVSGLLEKAGFLSDLDRANGLACIWNLVSRGCISANLWEPLSMTTALRLAQESAHVR